jgi:hypothetical protein
MPNDTRPFWLVWGANKRCHEANQATFATALHDQVPAKRHYDEVSARKEAQRLSNDTGARFYFFRAVGYCEPLPPEPRPIRCVELDGHANDTPT